MATKKSSPLKKSELNTDSKKKTVSKKTSAVNKASSAPVKKSSVVKKEVKPISIEETKLITKPAESEKKPLKSTSRSVDILKDAIQTAKAKQVSKENKETSKATYSKSDLVKKSEPKAEEETIEIKKAEPQKEEVKKEEKVYLKEEEAKKEEKIEKAKEEIAKKADTAAVEEKKEEIKKVEEIQVALAAEEKKEAVEPKEVYTVKEEKKEEIKTYIPIADKKPAAPYSMPDARIEDKNKSKKSPLPILIVILLIAVIAFFTIRFISPKKDMKTAGVENENTETNAVVTNEALSTNAMAYTDTNTALTTNNVLEPAPSIEVEKLLEETNKTVVLETPPKPPVEPVSPKVPESPVITPTITPPAIVSGENKIYMIKWKDTLETIALSELGDTRRWPTIYALNENVIITPDNYKFGDKINIPDNKKTLEQMTDAEKKALYEDYMKVANSYQKAGKTSLAEQVKARAKAIYTNY